MISDTPIQHVMLPEARLVYCHGDDKKRCRCHYLDYCPTHGYAELSESAATRALAGRKSV